MIDVGSSTQSYKIQMNKVDYDECYRSRKDGCTLVLKLMDKLFDRAELVNANLRGGTVMSKGERVVKQPLCSVKVNAMFSQADLQYPGFLAYIGTKAGEKEIRNAINGKCRHAGSLRTNQTDTATGTPGQVWNAL